VSNRGARYQRGTLTQSGGNWVVRIREDADGNRVERSHVVASMAEVRNRSQARTLADALVDRITGSGITAGATMGAAEYLRRYIAEHLVAMKPSSQSTIRALITKHLIPGVGRLRLEQITQRTAQQIIGTMLAAGLHSTTIRDAVKRLGRIMKQARLDGLACQPLDVRALSLPSKVETNSERKGCTQEEVVRLLSGASFPWGMAYALQATLGLRCAEVLGLAWRDFEGATVNIRRSVVRSRMQSLKSKTSAKRLAMPASLLARLSEYRATWAANADDLLFTSRKGTPVDSKAYREQLRKDCQALGITYRGTHAFRHFVASHLLRAGKSVSVTRDLMRHSNVSITNTYAHAVGADLTDAADHMGELLTKRNALNADVCGSVHAPDAGV
jgi:integrase